MTQDEIDARRRQRARRARRMAGAKPLPEWLVLLAISVIVFLVVVSWWLIVSHPGVFLATIGTLFVAVIAAEGLINHKRKR